MRLWRQIASVRTSFQTLVGLALATFALAAAAQGNSIESVAVNQLGSNVVVRINLKSALTEAPASFSIANPARIALDFPKTDNNTGKNVIESNQGELRNINVVQAGDRSRIVLNLRRSVQFKTAMEGNAVVVTLDSPVVINASAVSAAANAPNTSGTRFAEGGSGSHSLRDIDFRRGPDGEGRVIIDLTDPHTGIDIRGAGQTIVVDFQATKLPEALRRRLNVTDFGTPVQSINTFAQGNNVRVVIEPRGNWEHSAYQSESQLVVEVRPIKDDPTRLVPGSNRQTQTYRGERLSLNFQNVEVRSLLQVIADFTNFNVVTSDTVTGNVTLRLKDVPWDQALDIILQAKGLGMRKSGNVLWIAPKEELATKEQADLEAQKKIADLEPVRTQSFQLNYTKAEEVAKALIGDTTSSGSGSNGKATRILTQRGSVLYETRTNQLFVSDIPSKLEEVAMMITKIDIPVRQVLIEARVVEADDTFGRALGVKLGASDLRGVNGGIPGYSVGGSNYVTVGGNYNQIGYQTGQQTTNTAYSNTQFVSLPANTSAFTTSSAASFALSLFSASANRFLNLELSALESEGRGKVVSSPRVITTDQTKAEVEQGVEIPYQQATSSGATSVSFKKASLRLEVTPQITPEGNVILALEVNNDSRGTDTTAGPAINTKHVKTQVLVENGGTVVIGGIFTQQDRDDVNKVPLLGDIPVLGYLFKDRTRYTTRTELLVFITPKIVTDRSATR